MSAVFPSLIWVIAAVALVISAVGFYKYIYFFSLGYGFAIAGLGLVMLFLFRGELTEGTVLLCLLLAVYGVRLGGFLLVREVKSAAYAKFMNGEVKEGVGFGVKLAIWIACAALYVLEVIPVFYRFTAGAGTDGWCIAGAVVMAAGLLLETEADRQKSAAKKKDPGRFCDTGLYRLVRCPNYFGELVFWTGSLISGANILSGPGQWTMALLGYVGILYVMFSGARRLELRQDKNYGDDPVYQQYVKTVPIMIPFIPLYSVTKYKFLVA